MIRLALVFSLCCSMAVSAQQHWPSFRGGANANSATGKTLPSKWDDQTNVVWKAAIPGRGWSSPIVWGDRVFVTTVVSDKDQPEARKGLYIQDLQGRIMPGEHRWRILCLDRKTGETLWKSDVHKGQPETTVHIKNTYASETPVTDGERVYAYFGNIGLFAFDMKGKKLWEHKWPVYKTRMGWGTAASPAIHKSTLYVINDNEEKSFLAALDGKTGKKLWQVERDEKSNWVTPFVWENSQRTEIVTCGSNKIRSYDLDGNLLWELEGMSMIAIPTPSAEEDMLYVTSGYVGDIFRRPVYAIRAGAKGDISLKPKTTSNDSVVWSLPLAGPYHPSPLLYGGYYYILYDRGFLACYDAKTGKMMYERKRLPDARAFTTSPWAYNDKLFCTSEDGDTFVVRAGPEFQILGKNKLDGMTLATPAIANGSLFLRTQQYLYRIEDRSGGSGKTPNN